MRRKPAERDESVKTGKRTVIWILAAVAAITAFLGIGFLTVRSLWYRAGIVDAKDSPGGRYSVALYVAPPFPGQESLPGLQPLGRSNDLSGRVELRRGPRRLAVYDFVLSGEGETVRPDIWEVSWQREHVEVRILRTGQSDIPVKLFYDGEVLISRPQRRTEASEGSSDGEASGPPGVKKPSEGGSVSEKEQETAVPVESEEERRIREGYEAICQILPKEQGSCFGTEYDAKGNSRVYVYEDSAEARYLVYNRQSQNGLCGLYVYYSSRKAEDGSWSPMDASILTMYAYVYETGEVIDSGKRHWEDTGSQAYRNAAGEP